ncbi:MAG TPA: hypothetical protein VGM77_03800 [Gemmatimonadales bacterium]|jgi:hypothetical protein
MKRISLMVFSAVLGVTLLAVTAHQLRATQGTGAPGDNVMCYYNMYTCSYGDSWAYWDGCDPSIPQGWTATVNAKALCTTYHPS